jgi:alkylated DNA nucleotide flippase Atl1
MDDDYLEAVLDLVDAIPPGRVMTYGTIAEVVHEQLGRGGPRQVGTVLSRAGSGVPWWRVVNASGLPPAFKRTEALAVLRSEGCPLSDDGAADDVEARVVLRRALWWPTP